MLLALGGLRPLSQTALCSLCVVPVLWLPLCLGEENVALHSTIPFYLASFFFFDGEKMCGERERRSDMCKAFSTFYGFALAFDFLVLLFYPNMRLLLLLSWSDMA